MRRKSWARGRNKRFAVARIDDGFRRQFFEFIQRFDQLKWFTVGEVGPADGVFEESVAGE